MTEQEFLELLAARAGACARGELGIGDDAALLACPDGRLLVTTDAFVEGIHFPSWASPGKIVRRCVIAALSDINAMGRHANPATCPSIWMPCWTRAANSVCA